jgi:cell wall-associated NlpC family hydrolase
MYRKIAAISAGALILTGCVTPQNSEVLKVNNGYFKNVETTQLIKSISDHKASVIKQAEIKKNNKKMSKVLQDLKATVNKTWYVFSGVSPSGWDCSGLVLWTYKEIGINLEHRASKQQNAGKLVKSPQAGDIVVFKYKNKKDAYHVGIYYKDGKMIHAPKHGHLTRIESIKTFGGNYSIVEFRRLVETT